MKLHKNVYRNSELVGVDEYYGDISYGNKFNAFDKFYIVSLFFYCFLLFSPTLYAIIPLSEKISSGLRLLIAGILTIYVLHRGSVKVSRKVFFISFAFVLLAFVPTIYHQTTYLLFKEFISFYLVYMFYLFYKKKYLQPLVNIATPFMFVMLILSIIGFVYAFLGFQPIATGTLTNGRIYYLYLTTGAVDNGIFGNIIRPQAIYDEPGGFSFFICSLCFLRVFTKKNDAVTFLLMLLGNITFSMIHIILFALFVIHLIMKYKMKKIFIVYAALIFGITVLAYTSMKETLDELLFARFVMNKNTGHFEGNNRAYLLENVIELVKKDNAVLIWGLPRDDDGLTIMDKVWGYGENPLAPVVKFGIFIAWLYYFYLVFFVLCGVIDKKNFFMYFSIFLMLLQRPEFYKGGPTAILLMLLFTSWNIINKRLTRTKKHTNTDKSVIMKTNDAEFMQHQGGAIV